MLKIYSTLYLYYIQDSKKVLAFYALLQQPPPPLDNKKLFTNIKYFLFSTPPIVKKLIFNYWIFSSALPRPAARQKNYLQLNIFFSTLLPHPLDKKLLTIVKFFLHDFKLKCYNSALKILLTEFESNITWLLENKINVQ